MKPCPNCHALTMSPWRQHPMYPEKPDLVTARHCSACGFVEERPVEETG